jgi:Uma2 family endonuclease
VRIQQPIWAHDDSEPEPDVALVPLGDYSARHPDRAFLVIEVADSSLAFDRETKAPLYAASNVAEYWIVDLVGRAIEVCTEPKAGRFTHVRRVDSGGRVSPGAFAEVVLEVADVLPPG